MDGKRYKAKSDVTFGVTKKGNGSYISLSLVKLLVSLIGMWLCRSWLLGWEASKPDSSLQLPSSSYILGESEFMDIDVLTGLRTSIPFGNTASRQILSSFWFCVLLLLLKSVHENWHGNLKSHVLRPLVNVRSLDTVWTKNNCTWTTYLYWPVSSMNT